MDESKSKGGRPPGTGTGPRRFIKNMERLAAKGITSYKGIMEELDISYDSAYRYRRELRARGLIPVSHKKSMEQNGFQNQ